MSEPIASNAEIEAALQDAERNAARIPDLDEEGPVVPVPVAAERRVRPASSRPPPHNRPSAAAGEPPRIVVVQRLDDSPSVTVARSAGWRLAAVGDGVYRAADAALTALNLPFRRLSTTARNLIGVLAIVTIVVSVVCWVALPLLFPPRDPISVLQQESANVQRGSATAPADSAR